jgi:uncharacterized protein YndB with AHSA1/START domain
MGITLTVETIVNAPIERVWNDWVLPDSICQWNHAGDDWHCPSVVNDLQEGGEFVYTMAAKDGSFGFDFQGVYDEVVEPQIIKYTLADGRKVHIAFRSIPLNGLPATSLTEEFEAETLNPLEIQQQGWQMILNNFKKFVEGQV